jgi:hypothetical protein
MQVVSIGHEQVPGQLRSKMLTCMAVVFVGIFALVSYVQAKLIGMTLRELVHSSEFVAYGHTLPDPTSGPSAVWFHPTEVLTSGSANLGERVLLCNAPQEVESYDLRMLSESYVVFANKDKGCYKPVRGIISVIQVDRGLAKTFNLIGQPPEQEIGKLLAETRTLIKSRQAHT